MPVSNSIELSTDADSSFFKATMTFAKLTVAVLSNKMGFDALEEIGLISFKCRQIMVATFDNQSASFFWVLMASKAKTTPLRANCSIN